MGKTRNCRLTPEQKVIHKRAVSLRNMNDRELVALVDNKNLKDEEVKKERSFAILSFLENVSNIAGIGATTINKMKKYAEKEGYIES